MFSLITSAKELCPSKSRGGGHTINKLRKMLGVGVGVGGGGVIPLLISHIGMCRPKVYIVLAPFWSEFCPFWSEIGYGLQGNYGSV